MLLQNRPDDAWKVVSRLHGAGKGSNPSVELFAKEEFYQISRQAQADQAASAGENLWTLFTKRSYRHRMICAFLTMFGSESTGILVIYSKSKINDIVLSYSNSNGLDYSVLLYQGLGFKKSIPLVLAAAYVTVAAIGNYLSSLLMDRIGRVRLLRAYFSSQIYT